MPPVSEPYSPITISFWEPFEPQDSVAARTAARQAAARIRNLMMTTSSFSGLRKDGVFFRRGRRKVKTSFLSMA